MPRKPRRPAASHEPPKGMSAEARTKWNIENLKARYEDYVEKKLLSKRRRRPRAKEQTPEESQKRIDAWREEIYSAGARARLPDEEIGEKYERARAQSYRRLREMARLLRPVVHAQRELIVLHGKLGELKTLDEEMRRYNRKYSKNAVDANGKHIAETREAIHQHQVRFSESLEALNRHRRLHHEPELMPAAIKEHVLRRDKRRNPGSTGAPERRKK